MKNKGITKAAKVLAKIFEVFHWVGAALMVGMAVCAVVAPDWIKYFIGYEAKECCGATLDLYGFEIVAPVVNGEADLRALVVFGIGAVIILALMAMIFRNLYLIIKKPEGNTPFQKDNIRMLNEIGYFSIAIPVVSLIMGFVAGLVLGNDVETSTSIYGFAMGVIVLGLTQFFVHGAELEEDVDGLL